MKKIVVTLVFLTALTLTAQDQVSLIYVDGDMIHAVDTEVTALNKSELLQDCTSLSPDGSFVTVDGEQDRLKNGECMDMYGIQYRNEYQYRYKVGKENRHLTQTQLQSRYQNKYHFVKIDGQVYKIKNGSQKKLKKEFKLSNGTIVSRYATYQIPDQDEAQLQDGECLNMQGVKFDDTYEQRKLMAKTIKKLEKAEKVNAL